MILYIIIIILLMHYIFTFFMSAQLQRKIFVNNYISKKYNVINNSIYVFGNKRWHIKQLIIILISIILSVFFADKSISTLEVIVLGIIIDQIYRILLLYYAKRNNLIHIKV